MICRRKCIILWLLLISLYNIACEDCNQNIVQVIECSDRCCDVVKPFLQYFKELKNTADKSIECQNEVRIKNEQIRCKDEIISEKNERIREKNEIINRLSDQIKELTSIGTLMNEKDKEIQTIREHIKTKNIEIQKTNDEIKRKNELLAAKDTNIHENEKQIKFKDIEIQKLKKDIQEKDMLINTKDKEIREKNDETTSKEDQNRELTNRLNNANEKLSKCDQIHFCPYTGTTICHIQLPKLKAFEAPSNGSGWMVIQRRMDGSENFNRNWNDYKKGFGNMTGEFFIGLEKLHAITQSIPHELKILMGDKDGSTAFAHYDDFKIGNEENLYALQVLGNWTGNAGNPLDYHKNMNFSTFDNDNDLYIDVNCAAYYAAGWWFNACSQW